MKPFNIYLLIALVTILGGFFFFKDGLTRQASTSAFEQSPSMPLYDRLQYLDYTKETFASSKKSGKTVLFFAATTWCSNCVALDKEIKERINELPQDTTILKVDYDNDKETKAQYAVTMQTTLILLDNNGKEDKRWIGTNFNNLLENIN